MIIFMIGVIFNITIIFVLYWIFTLNQVPLNSGEYTSVITAIILLISTFLIKDKLLDKFDIPQFRKTVILLSSMLATLMTMVLFTIFLNEYNYKARKIEKIEDFNASRTNSVRIKNFEIINKPFVYSKLDTRRNNTKYYELFFLYPFKSKDHQFYYVLNFEKQIERWSEDDHEAQYAKFLKKTKDSLKHYDFHQTHTFESISSTKFSTGLPENQRNTIFLEPTTQFKKFDKKDSTVRVVIGFIVILISYIVIFFISNTKK